MSIKRSWRKLLLVAPILALTSCAFMGGMDAKCDEKQIREIPAPSGTVKAVELHSVCDGNVYVATINVAGGAAGGRSTAMHAQSVNRASPPVWPNLKVEWKSDKELWITYPAGVDVTCVSSPPGVAVHCLDASIAR
jgi:hypothetical protein